MSVSMSGISIVALCDRRHGFSAGPASKRLADRALYKRTLRGELERKEKGMHRLTHSYTLLQM